MNKARNGRSRVGRLADENIALRAAAQGNYDAWLVAAKKAKASDTALAEARTDIANLHKELTGANVARVKAEWDLAEAKDMYRVKMQLLQQTQRQLDNLKVELALREQEIHELRKRPPIVLFKRRRWLPRLPTFRHQLWWGPRPLCSPAT